jgi:hypothetical protein
LRAIINFWREIVGVLKPGGTILLLASKTEPVE